MKELMVQVERTVRPVRAGVHWKDRMRQELLAHLTGLYEEELARLGNESAAREAALQRFGEPAELMRDLQESLSREARISFWMEQWFGWRAPESAARFTFRLAVRFLLVMSFLSALVITAVLLNEGQTDQVLSMMRLRPLLALLLIGSLDVFLMGLLYYRMRDAMLGAWGIPRSWLRVVGIGVLFSLVACASGLLYALIAVWNGAMALELLDGSWIIASLIAPIIPVVYGLVFGPAEIRHTVWECLDIG